MPAPGTTTKRKRYWLQVTERAISEVRRNAGRNFRQTDVLQWIQDHAEEYPEYRMPEERTLRGYIASLTKPGEFDAPFSLGLAYEQHLIPGSITEDALPSIMDLWLDRLTRGIPFTLQQAIWVSRTHPFSPRLQPGESFTFAAAYAREERLSKAIGEPFFDSSLLDLNMALAIRGWSGRWSEITYMARELNLITGGLLSLSNKKVETGLLQEVIQSDQQSTEVMDLYDWIIEGDEIRERAEKLDEERSLIFMLAMRVVWRRTKLTDEQRKQLAEELIGILERQEYDKLDERFGVGDGNPK